MPRRIRRHGPSDAETGDAETGHGEISYTANAKTIRTATHRMIRHHDGHVELHDHRSGDGETINVADRFPGVVNELKARLDDRLRS